MRQIFAKGEVLQVDGHRVEFQRTIHQYDPFRAGDVLIDGERPRVGVPVFKKLIDEAKHRLTHTA